MGIRILLCMRILWNGNFDKRGRKEKQVIKCLNEHLKDYLDNDFSQRLINRIYDEFILDHFRIKQTIERVKKQYLKSEVEK